MLLGALIDAGVPLAEVRGALGSLAIDAETVWTERVTRAGLAATKFCVRGQDATRARRPRHQAAQPCTARPRAPPRHAHGHATHEPHGHRTLAEIAAPHRRLGAQPRRARTAPWRLSTAWPRPKRPCTARRSTRCTCTRSARSIRSSTSWARVHALEQLGVDRIEASPLNVGSGTIRSAHGIYPVPAPATLRLLRDAPGLRRPAAGRAGHAHRRAAGHRLRVRPSDRCRPCA